MMLKLLKISLLLVLVISFLGLTVDKNIEKNKSNPEKVKLVKELTSKKTSPVWKKTHRQISAADISKVDKSSKIKAIKKVDPIAISIADYYGDEVAVVENFNSMAGLSSGTSIGTSTFTYGAAYQGRNIAIGSDGVIHAIWSTGPSTAGNRTMYAQSADGGTTWTTPVQVNDGYYGYKPAIDVDFANPQNVYVAYIGYMNEGETRTARVVKSADGGATWLASALVAGSNVNTNNPDIMVDSKGGVHVAFDSYADTFIRYNYSADGGTTWFTEPEIVNVGFGGETFGATVAIDLNDNPHVLFGGGGAAGSWGDKGTYWNWRDMATNTWQEVPPVELAPEGVGFPYPSMVFDSQGVGHCFYDNAGTVNPRAIFYQTWDQNSGWTMVGEIEPLVPGGYTVMCQSAIDAYDNLFVGYVDGLDGGFPGFEPNYGDFFSGTNITGEWQYVNVSGNGTGTDETHINVARRVLPADTVLHCLYHTGPGPVDIIYEVGFPYAPNPSCGVTILPDTYNPNGPFHVVAETGDLDGVTVACSLYVWLNDEQVEAINMTSTAPDVWEADFSLTGSVGDEVVYQGVAIDNDDLTGESIPATFYIIEPENPYADILLVGDQMQFLNVFDQSISDLGYVYEYWDVDAHRGIDASVTTWGWNNIIVGGWAIGSVPTRDYTDDPYAAFLDGGGNMALISMDWFFGQGEDAGEISFDPGDFAYDYFQIGGGTNDPAQDIDSLLIGIGGDPISTTWSDVPLEFNVAPSAITNWMDQAYATGNGVDCFYAFNQGFETGVWNDAGTFKTAYLAFMLEWLVTDDLLPNADAVALMENILTFFGAVSPPMLGETTGPRYGVYGYGPFDVSASATDEVLAKGARSVVSMEVGYMAEGDADYTWVPLTDAGGGLFTGQIPELPATPDVMYAYRFKATDDMGLSNMNRPTYFLTTGMEYTEGVKLLYCGDDYYDWYYTTNLGFPYVVDEAVTGTLDQVALDNNFTYDYWDVDMYGPPDYQTVLSNYTSVIWHGYADWEASVFPINTVDNPLYPYLLEGGNLLFSSEEMVGTLYDWPDDYSPGPGESAYDVLNVGWIGADYNYDTSRVFSTTDPLTVGMDSILALVELPWGFMGDLTDPVNNDAYIFDAWLPDYGAWYGDWGYGVAWRYQDPTYNYKHFFMAYCLANLDDANRYAFLKNACDWFGVTGIDRKVSEDIPKTFALRHNYPNPFNPTTSIAYDLPKATKIDLAIYNVLGQKIRTLVTGSKEAGRYVATWDGKNDFGTHVASGVYFYKIIAGDFIQSYKMMLVK